MGLWPPVPIRQFVHKLLFEVDFKTVTFLAWFMNFYLLLSTFQPGAVLYQRRTYNKTRHICYDNVLQHITLSQDAS